MPFLIVRNDITRMQVDAIVNPARPSLQGGGGADGAIHAAAGPALREACLALGGCPVGQARLTPGFALPARWVIHTVPPHWHGGLTGERRRLQACYRSALRLAREQGFESVAFPLIGAGACGFPREIALEAARQELSPFLEEGEMTVYLVVYGEESLALSRERFAAVGEYIDSRYVREHQPLQNRREELEEWNAVTFGAEHAPAPEETSAPAMPAPPMAAGKPAARRKQQLGIGAPAPAAAAPGWVFGELDESFQQMLLRKIDESGMTDAACYKKANIDRKLFSKIRKDAAYKPSKPTALAFAVALGLDLRETRELLGKAGYALSRSSKQDLIVQYYIERKNYNIYEINEALFAFDQSLLGNQG